MRVEKLKAHRRRLAAAVIAAALIAIAIVLVAQGGGSGDDDSRAVDTAPHFVAASDLTALEDSLGRPVYWAGERPPARIELTEESNVNVYLRYLPPGSETGNPHAEVLTVGSYPVDDAQQALRAVAGNESRLGRVAGGGLILYNPSAEGGSVYLAYPGSNVQIEVYDPVPGKALRLIRSGAIEPVG